MKKSTLFKSIMAATFMVVLGIGANAQTSLNYVNDSEADSVVVGARMPYFVKPDASVASMVTAGLLNASYYKWILSDGGTPLKYDGTAATAGSVSGYFKENEISYTWPSTTGSYTVKVTERSNPKTGLADGCDGSEETRNVVVVDKPTIDYTNAGGYLGACGSTSIDVPITLSGTGPWKVSYTVTAPNGTDILTVTDQIISNGNMPYTSSIKTLPLTINFASTPLTGVAGVYKVKITQVTDRLTAKALNSIVGTISTTTDYNVGVLATPTTSPIQHIKNL